MYELTLKRRVAIFFGVLFLLLPLGCGGLYIALDSVVLYFSFPPAFVFSSFTIYGFTIFLMVIPLAFLSFFPVFFGRLASLSIQKNISLFIFVCFFFFIMLQIVFKLYFESELEHKGYIACRGIPSGWMPGMATKYVTNEVLCSKKDP
ncbi:hypothetical protein [Mangrovibacter phragmitis]|uniref:hypothetical protein n=1 Tax=Mangrovibacter phragmitis TaxID=1691903 RepID=UPI003514CCE1